MPEVTVEEINMDLKQKMESIPKKTENGRIAEDELKSINTITETPP